MRHATRSAIFVGLMYSVSLLSFLPEWAVAMENQAIDDSGMPKLMVPHTPSRKNFPCTKCHGFRAENRTRRQLVEHHADIELKHAEDQRWCYDCHDGDRLRLLNGRLIPFEQSHLLCGQCHGTIFRDWKAGSHGKRTGMWSGDKLYRVCANCHDAHRPGFRAIQPKEPPMRPSDIKERG